MTDGHATHADNDAIRQGDSPTPSADGVTRLANQRLADCPYADLRHVTCSEDNGVLSLQGRVTSFYLKQLAQEIVRRAEGVGEIINSLEVDDPRRAPAGDH